MNKAVATNFLPGKKRVFVVDDHPIVRQGLALLINQESDLTVCGEADLVKTFLRPGQVAIGNEVQ